MSDLKDQMKDYFLQYASYVICDRAIPNVVDGLKPVQRRILEILFRQNDEKLHKVANIVGQTMQLHPHGDAAIYEALVNLANKGFLLDRQGNFGNIYTGDPAAAARYIETRLSPLARATLFNPELTEKIPSYDARNEEPIVLPAKIPLLLMQGAEGIAVGMSTRILPHNFSELIQAEIAHLEGKSFQVYPDFPTGGIMDKDDYAKGKGKIKLRAKIEIVDPKTIVIREICYGTTTESLIRSIDEAAKKGKIKIEAINDYTSRNVEIEVKLPRGQYAEEMIDALYAFTECEVSLSSQILVIREGIPWETDVHEIIIDHTEKLTQYLKVELQIERDKLLEKIFYKTLERIFIENKIYKKIEPIRTLEGIHEMLITAFNAHRKKLFRDPTQEDRERLLQIPIRRISQFDIAKNKDEIVHYKESLLSVEKSLKQIKKYTIKYLKQLIEKFGSEFKRKTRIKAIEEIDLKAIQTKNIQVGFDSETGYVGTRVSGDNSISCTNFDKLIVFNKEGAFRVINIPSKAYFEGACFIGIADKTTVINILYKIKKTGIVFAKRFVVDKYILEKEYRYFEEGATLEGFTTDPKAQFELRFAKGKEFGTFKEIPIKSVKTKGERLFREKVKKVIFSEKKRSK